MGVPVIILIKVYLYTTAPEIHPENQEKILINSPFKGCGKSSYTGLGNKSLAENHREIS